MADISHVSIPAALMGEVDEACALVKLMQWARADSDRSYVFENWADGLWSIELRAGSVTYEVNNEDFKQVIEHTEEFSYYETSHPTWSMLDGAKYILEHVI